MRKIKLLNCIMIISLFGFLNTESPDKIRKQNISVPVALRLGKHN